MNIVKVLFLEWHRIKDFFKAQDPIDPNLIWVVKKTPVFNEYEVASYYNETFCYSIYKTRNEMDAFIFCASYRLKQLSKILFLEDETSGISDIQRYKIDQLLSNYVD